MNNFFTTLVLVLLLNVSFAQTGPGGIGNNTTNPYWIDVHTNGGANGGSISSLTDYSGNGTDAIQASLALQPTFVTNAVNGVSAVSFDGTDCMVSGANSALNGNQFLNVYMYGNITDNSYLSIPLNLDYGNVNTEDAYTGIITQNGLTKVYGRKSNGSLVKVSYGATSGYNLFQSTFINSTNRLNATLNFSQMGTTTTATATTPTLNQSVWLGGKSSAYKMTGFISEAFIFNTVLNSAEENILQNYISAKYGTTIVNDMYAYQATHQFGVVGIGQDDAANSHLSSQGNGVVSITSSGISNGDYLFIGHDDVELYNSLLYDVPASMASAARMARVWRADETSDIGTITLVFDLDPISDFSADPNNYRLLIDHSDDDFSTVDLMLAGIYNAGANSITFTNVDLTSGDYFTLAGDAPQDVISITNGLWSQPTTWNCSCVPSSFDKVTVDAGHSVTLDVNSIIVDLTINPTGVLTWMASEDLEISGDLKVDGLVDMGVDGELSMIGTAPQGINLGGNQVEFTNLEISNLSTGVTVSNGTLVLNGALSPLTGGFDYSAISFIVNSTSATTSGRIGSIAAGFTMNGVATVKRFLAPGNAAERTISSSVEGANLSMWDADISISGTGFPDGCAMGPEGCYHSCKKFNGGEFGTDYIDVTNPSEPLESGVGYELFIGDDLNTFSGATLSSTGSLRDGNDFAFGTMSFGWNIVGNPYASPISFSTIGLNKVYTYIYIYDAASGSYQWYDKPSNSSSIPELANGVLAIGQGYWVNCYSNNAPTLTYKQSDKISTTATFIRNAQDQDNSIYLTLTQEGTTYKNIVNIDFNDEAFDGKDSLDMLAFTIGKQKASSVYINVDGQLLAKNYLNTDGRDKVLDLSIKILEEGYFTFSASNLENVSNYNVITLIDNVTGDVIDLKSEMGYTFYASEEQEVKQRFQLILSNKVIENNGTSIFESGNTESELTITQMGNAINVESDEAIEGITEISIVNLLGQEIVYSETINIESGSNMIFVPSSLSGMYLVIIKSTNGLITKKIML